MYTTKKHYKIYLISLTNSKFISPVCKTALEVSNEGLLELTSILVLIYNQTQTTHCNKTRTKTFDNKSRTKERVLNFLPYNIYKTQGHIISTELEQSKQNCWTNYIKTSTHLCLAYISAFRSKLVSI